MISNGLHGLRVLRETHAENSFLAIKRIFQVILGIFAREGIVLVNIFEN